MPTFQLQTADGKTFEVDAPDQMTAIASLSAHAGHPASLLDSALKPITSLPSIYEGMVHGGMEQMGRGVHQVESGHPWDIAKGIGNIGMGALEYVTAPVNAPIHTIVGEPVRKITEAAAGPTAGNLAGTTAELAAGLALPLPHGIPRAMEEAPVVPTQMGGVTLSEGQAAHDLPMIQREQAALGGRSGPAARRQAQQFVEQQQRQLADKRAGLTAALDPVGQRMAESPQEAGEIVSRDLRSAAAASKRGVRSAYEQAQNLGGEIHAGAFEGIANRIKSDLSSADQPVIIDDKLTPFAARMIGDIESRVANLRVQNRADPFGQPNPQNIVGISLKGVDQMRRRLSTFRGDAMNSGNAADARAARAVLDAFDKEVDGAVNGGLFSGEPAAVKAWNAARAANHDYRSLYSAGKNDPVGRVVEKIIGKGKNEPAIPNDVADYLYGASGTNPSGLNVGVAKRLKTVLGETSPAWSAVRQGLFERLTGAGEGMKPWGAGKVADRLNRFLKNDGREMAATVFTPAQRDMLQSYADLMRQIEVPQAGANWSNTGAFAAESYKESWGHRLTSAVAQHILGHVAGTVGRFLGSPVARRIEGMSSQAREARVIARQMPIVGKQFARYRKALVDAEGSRTGRNVARATMAARNLANNLADLGINISPAQLLGQAQGPQPASAEQKNQ